MMTNGIPVFLTIAGEQWIAAEIYQTGRQLNGIDLDMLLFCDVYFAIHASYDGKGEVTFTDNQLRLPYISFSFIRINGKIAGYKHPADVVRIILALPLLHSRITSQD